VQEEDLTKARELFVAEAADKPEDKREQIVQGKLDSFLKEKVLLEQDFVKDSSRTIRDLVEGATQKFGERVEITACVRYSVR
jgi:elongation factor Ts